MDLVSNRLYKQRIGPVTEIDEHLAEVDADPQQLEQVLVKLYSISMTDTGFGIEPENVPKIFHPFFRTNSLGWRGALPACIIADVDEA